MKSNKMIYISGILTGIISLFLIEISFNILNTNSILEMITTENIKNNNDLAIMIWDEDEEEYKKYEGSETTFPSRSDYVYMSEDSGCMNLWDQKVDNVMEYDDKLGKVTITTKETVKCYLYYKEGKKLTINKGEGIDKIYFKYGDMEEYEESSNSVAIALLPGTSYSYYGIVHEGYAMNACTQNSKCEGTIENEGVTINIEGEEIKTIEAYVRSLANESGSNGVVMDTHSIFETGSQVTNDVTTDYRYIGSNPNNYVKLQNKDNSWTLYRIIGVFKMPVITNGVASTAEYEWRVKLIMADQYTVGAENSKHAANDYYLTSSHIGHRWSGSSSNNSNNINNSTILNSTGLLNNTYWNSLSDDTRNLIGPSIWYIGGYDNSNSGYPQITPSEFYQYERSNQLLSGNPTNVINKIELMYPSDFGYATNGGSITNRNSCTNIYNFYEWKTQIECLDNNWLYMSKQDCEWFITPTSTLASGNQVAFHVNLFDGVSIIAADRTFWYVYNIRPTFYLNSNVKLVGIHDGTSTDPYEVSL